MLSCPNLRERAPGKVDPTAVPHVMMQIIDIATLPKTKTPVVQPVA
jgi:hypothetical protein